MPDSLSFNTRLKSVEPISAELQTRTGAYWRARADEARLVAAQMADDLSRQTMENIATSYGKLAEWAEKRLRGR